jgi:hypothetical protein
MHGDSLPRGQYTPECRKGFGQDVSSADEIGIAPVIAGDTSKHLSLAVAPIVLTTGVGCRVWCFPVVGSSNEPSPG